MRVSKIYFDMDGVLADFDDGVATQLGLNLSQFNSVQGYNKAVWSRMQTNAPHFYRQLKPISEMVSLFKRVYANYGDSTEILTGLPRTDTMPFAAQDKVAWVEQYMQPAQVRVNTVMSWEKKDFAKGTSYILIDDRTQNIAEWKSYGGTGVLFQTPSQVEHALVELGILQGFDTIRPEGRGLMMWTYTGFAAAAKVNAKDYGKWDTAKILKVDYTRGLCMIGLHGRIKEVSIGKLVELVCYGLMGLSNPSKLKNWGYWGNVR